MVYSYMFDPQSAKPRECVRYVNEQLLKGKLYTIVRRCSLCTDLDTMPAVTLSGEVSGVMIA